MSSPQHIVEEAIKNNKVVVFAKSYCPYCKKAKALLDSLNIEHYDLELDLIPEGPEIQEYLLQKTNQKTVPNIFISQQHLGGSDALAKAHENGSLQKLLGGN